MNVKILHLYYDLMNLYGEYANMVVLEQHLIDQGMSVTVEKKSIGDNIIFGDYDFIYMGAGTEKKQITVLNDLKEKYLDDIKIYIESGKIALFTGNSYELLGSRIGDVEALKILDFEVDVLNKRNNSDIVATSDIFNNKIVGFINNMTSIKNNQNPLLKIEFGKGESIDSMSEGIKYKETIGTHLIGPLLVRNPEVLKYFVTKICSLKNKDFRYKECQYEEEQKGYEFVLKELENRKS